MGNAAVRAQKQATDKQGVVDGILTAFDKEAEDIIAMYNTRKYSNVDALCQTLSWHYTDKLKGMFDVVTLQGVSAQLGIDVEKLGEIDISAKAEAYKTNVCKNIVGFYIAKVKAITNIKNVLDKCVNQSDDFIKSWKDDKNKFQKIASYSLTNAAQRADYQRAKNAYNELKDFQGYIIKSKDNLRNIMVAIANSKNGPEQRDLIQKSNKLIGEVGGTCEGYTSKLTEWSDYVELERRQIATLRERPIPRPPGQVIDRPPEKQVRIINEPEVRYVATTRPPLPTSRPVVRHNVPPVLEERPVIGESRRTYTVGERRYPPSRPLPLSSDEPIPPGINRPTKALPTKTTGILKNPTKPLPSPVEIDEVNRILLDGAINNNILDVKYALENGADIEVKRDQKTPLILASENGNVDIIEMLLDEGASRKQEALSAAIAGTEPAAVRAILNTGGTNLRQALGEAIKNNKQNAVRDILAIRDPEGKRAVRVTQQNVDSTSNIQIKQQLVDVMKEQKGKEEEPPIPPPRRTQL